MTSTAIARAAMLLVAAATLAGCGRGQRLVRRNFSFNMNCPVEVVQTWDLGGGVVGVRGCGRMEKWQCVKYPFVGLQCERIQ